LARSDPAWWADARRLYRMRFMRPDGTRLKLRYPDSRGSSFRLLATDVARILDRPVMSVRYALSDATRSAMKRYQRSKAGLPVDDAAAAQAVSEARRQHTAALWARRWREQYRRERGIVPTRVEPFRLDV
jgi:hypothetical protein